MWGICIGAEGKYILFQLVVVGRDKKGKKRKKAAHLTELKEKTKRLETEKAQLLQQLLHTR